MHTACRDWHDQDESQKGDGNDAKDAVGGNRKAEGNAKRNETRYVRLD